jgi:hypothetical protein
MRNKRLLYLWLGCFILILIGVAVLCIQFSLIGYTIWEFVTGLTGG